MPRVRGAKERAAAGLDGLIMLPVKRHGSKALSLRPRLLSILLILVYQCRGLQRRPYKVRLRSQYLSFLALGSQIGVLTVVISLSGRMPWQKAFIQLPCLSVRLYSTTMLTISRIVTGGKMGAYFLDFVQTRSLWLPSTMMRGFVRSGFNISSFLMERTHMVGIACEVPFAQRALYLARLILI